MGQRTPLYDWHAGHGAKIVDFAGWEMPVMYSAIVAEHQATRGGCGLFDISHMGRLRVTGPDACRWLDHLFTNRMDTLKPGQVRYTLALNEQGCILDDILVTRFPDHYLVVVNASNRPKLLPWFEKHRAGFDAKLVDETEAVAMIAVQGPNAIAAAQPLVESNIGDLKYYFAAETKVLGAPGVVSRTGYTGEDGVELLVPAAKATETWEKLVAAGGVPIGLGARDTLRLEAAMPLYGHELDEETDPLQAGLAWAVKAAEKDFLGKPALAKRDPGRPVRVGLKLADKRIARENFAIFAGGERIGRTTSGTLGPTVGYSLAMAYVPPAFAQIGTGVEIEIRSQRAAAVVVPLPFYKREK